MRKGEMEGRLDPNFYLRECFEIKDILTRKYGVHYLKSVVADIYRYPTFYSIEYRQQGIPIIKGENINKDGLINPNQEFDYIDEETHRNFPRTELRENDLVFTVRGLIGKVGIFEGFSTVGNINANVIKIRIKEGFSHKFFWIYLNSNIGQKLIGRITSGQVQQTITVPDILKLQIPIPPIEIQKQIIEKFEAAYNAKRSKEAQAKSLLDSVDAYLLERLGLETPAASKTSKTFFVYLSNVSGNRLDCIFHKAILSNNFKSQFPTIALNKLVSTYCGGTPDKSNPNYWGGNIFWVSPKDFRGLEISKSEDTITEEGLKRSSTKLVEAENVLIVVRSGILQHTLPIAVNKIDAAINQDVKALEIKDKSKLNPYYLTFYLKTFQDRLLPQIVKHGTIVQSINTQQFDKLRIPVPPLEVQEEIAAHIQSIRESARELEREAQVEVERAKAEVERMILGEAAADA